MAKLTTVMISALTDAELLSLIETHGGRCEQASGRDIDTMSAVERKKEHANASYLVALVVERKRRNLN